MEHEIYEIWSMKAKQKWTEDLTALRVQTI